MWQIYNHVKRNSDIQIISGNFFFKVDDKDRVCLLFATSLLTDQHVPVLNGSGQVTLGIVPHKMKILNNWYEAVSVGQD